MQRTLRHNSDLRLRQAYGNDDDQLSKEKEWENYKRSNRTVVCLTEDDNASLQVQGSRTRIKRTELYKLKPGDHIGWRRSYDIWHHAIVIDTRLAKNELLVIHYTKVNGSVEISKQLIEADDQNGELFRFDYSEDTELKNPAKVVLDRAHNLIGKKEYNLLTNNCEHLARYCKTGERESSQSRWVAEKAKQLTISNGAKLGSDIQKKVTTQMQLSNIMEIPARLNAEIMAAEAVAHVKQSLLTRADGVNMAGNLGYRISMEVSKKSSTTLAEAIAEKGSDALANEAVAHFKWSMARSAQGGVQCGSKLTNELFKVFTKRSSSTVANGAGKVAAAEVVETASRSSNWVGTGIMFGFEAIHCGYDIYKLNKASKLSSDDFKVEVATRVGEGLCSATGAAIGSYVGGYLGGVIGGIIGSAVPIFGTALGTFGGNVIGGAIGSTIGKSAGLYLGRSFGTMCFER